MAKDGVAFGARRVFVGDLKVDWICKIASKRPLLRLELEYCSNHSVGQGERRVNQAESDFNAEARTAATLRSTQLSAFADRHTFILLRRQHRIPPHRVWKDLARRALTPPL